MKTSIVVIIAIILATPISTSIASTDKQSLGHIGVYIYESLEGYHSISSTCGNLLSQGLIKCDANPSVQDRVPLVTNESVRILEEMTEDRKIVVSPVVAWFTGGSIISPSITIADDDIKFVDLTWHIDTDRVMGLASELDHVLIGTVSGQLRRTQEQAAQSGSTLVSVTVRGNFRIVRVADGSVIWATTQSTVKAGFDPRVAFEGGIENISEKVVSDLTSFLTPNSKEMNE